MEKENRENFETASRKMEHSEFSKGKFLEVICSRCGHKQIVFGKSSTRVKCESCNKLLVKNSGGKARIKSWIREIIS